MKLVINTKIGSFQLSEKAYLYLKDKYFITVFQRFIMNVDSNINVVHDCICKNMCDEQHYWYSDNMFCDKNRNDARLIDVVETLKEEAGREYDSLKIVEIPDNIEFYIHENDMGIESIHEKHRIWN